MPQSRNPCLSCRLSGQATSGLTNRISWYTKALWNANTQNSQLSSCHGNASYKYTYIFESVPCWFIWNARIWRFWSAHKIIANISNKMWAVNVQQRTGNAPQDVYINEYVLYTHVRNSCLKPQNSMSQQRAYPVPVGDYVRTRAAEQIAWPTPTPTSWRA